jgi:hypothetical protein
LWRCCEALSTGANLNDRGRNVTLGLADLGS